MRLGIVEEFRTSGQLRCDSNPGNLRDLIGQFLGSLRSAAGSCFCFYRICFGILRITTRALCCPIRIGELHIGAVFGKAVGIAGTAACPVQCHGKRIGREIRVVGCGIPANIVRLAIVFLRLLAQADVDDVLVDNRFNNKYPVLLQLRLIPGLHAKI